MGPGTPFLKLPSTLRQIRNSLDKDKYSSINLYYQDESRFGLKTFVGRYLSVKGLRPKLNYQHRFKNTYLWGSYSPITGDQFVLEIDGVDKIVFKSYLNALSSYKPEEYKILVIDNAGFHSTKDMEIPDNIHLLRIPPYSPELKPLWFELCQRKRSEMTSEVCPI